MTHDRLKSAPANVTRRRDRYSIVGAAWGAPIAEVEVQIDGDAQPPGRPAQAVAVGVRLELLDAGLGQAHPGRAHIKSRAYEFDRNVQPPPDDAYLAGKVTFWESNGQITRRVRIPAGP